MPPSPNLHDRRERLRALVASGRTIAAPGAIDALSARLIESHGFEAVYIGSYATAASRFALPDTGLLTLNDLAAQARTIANAVKLPVIADAEGGFNVKLAMFFWTYLWPAVIATGIVACTTRTARLKLLGAYAGVFALLAAAALARSPHLRWYEPAAFWVFTNGLETALLFLFLARPIRAVGPLVVTFAVLALGGGVLAINVIGASDATMRAAAEAGELLNFGVVEVFGYTIAFGLAPSRSAAGSYCAGSDGATSASACPTSRSRSVLPTPGP